MTSASFAASDGWKLATPKLNQRRLPFFQTPTPGIKTPMSARIVRTRKIHESGDQTGASAGNTPGSLISQIVRSTTSHAAAVKHDNTQTHQAAHAENQCGRGRLHRFGLAPLRITARDSCLCYWSELFCERERAPWSVLVQKAPCWRNLPRESSIFGQH